VERADIFEINAQRPRTPYDSYNPLSQMPNSIVKFNEVDLPSYIDLGSTVSTVKVTEANKLGLVFVFGRKPVLRAYGHGSIQSLGSSKVEMETDQIVHLVEVIVVPDEVQDSAVLVGQTFTEPKGVVVVKDDKCLKFLEKSSEEM